MNADGTICQRPESRNTLLLCLPGSCFCGIKCEFTHAEQVHRLVQHGTQIVGKIFCRRVIRTDDKQLFIRRFCKRSSEICPVNGRKTGNKRRKSTAFPKEGEGGCFLVIQNLAKQNIH